MQPSERAGAIYDIGYRRYEGERSGRRGAFETLFWQGFRAAFGLGRRPLAKVAPWLLSALALLPAAVYLGIAAIAPADLDIIETSDYLDIIFIILILFVAAVTPEIVGRDLRFRTLSLYFTRPIERDDYALARLAAVTAATLAVTLVPQLTLVVGNALATEDAWEYVREEWAELPRVVVTGAVAAVYASAVGLAISSQTHRRSFAMGGIVAFFLISAAVGGILGETLAGEFVLLDPGNQLRCLTLLVFNQDPGRNEQLGSHDVPLIAGVFVLAGYLAAAIAVLLRRYRTVPA
jgi:ABC-2 type transport system permease protein